MVFLERAIEEAIYAFIPVCQAKGGQPFLIENTIMHCAEDDLSFKLTVVPSIYYCFANSCDTLRPADHGVEDEKDCIDGGFPEVLLGST